VAVELQRGNRPRAVVILVGAALNGVVGAAGGVERTALRDGAGEEGEAHLQHPRALQRQARRAGEPRRGLPWAVRGEQRGAEAERNGDEEQVEVAVLDPGGGGGSAVREEEQLLREGRGEEEVEERERQRRGERHEGREGVEEEERRGGERGEREVVRGDESGDEAERGEGRGDEVAEVQRRGEAAREEPERRDAEGQGLERGEGQEAQPGARVGDQTRHGGKGGRELAARRAACRGCCRVWCGAADLSAGRGRLAKGVARLAASTCLWSRWAIGDRIGGAATGPPSQLTTCASRCRVGPHVSCSCSSKCPRGRRDHESRVEQKASLDNATEKYVFSAKTRNYWTNPIQSPGALEAAAAARDVALLLQRRHRPRCAPP